MSTSTSNKLQKNNSIYNMGFLKYAQSSIKFSQEDLKNSIFSLKMKKINSQKNLKKKKTNRKVRKTVKMNIISKYKKIFTKTNYQISKNILILKNKKKKKENLRNYFVNKNLVKNKNDYLQALENYKNIFKEEKKNFEIKKNQLKLILSNLGILGYLNCEWVFLDKKEEKMINLFFDIFKKKNNKIDFDIIKSIFYFFNEMKKNDFFFNVFEKKKISKIFEKKEKKNILNLKSILKKDFSFSNKDFVNNLILSKTNLDEKNLKKEIKNNKINLKTHELENINPKDFFSFSAFDFQKSINKFEKFKEKNNQEEKSRIKLSKKKHKKAF